MIFFYIVGTAGSGKSMLTHKFNQWMHIQGYDSVTVNLDPGVEQLAYVPDVDIRDWVSLKEIMSKYDLGPNGAQIAASDIMALNIEDVKTSIAAFETDYVLFDTPGQVELFAFRESSRHILTTLGVERSLLGFLFDPALANEPNGFISQILLSATVQFRLGLTTVNVLSKIDLLDDDALDKILRWGNEPETLSDALSAQTSVSSQMSSEFLRVLEELGTYKALTPVSAMEMHGIVDLYTIAQQTFAAGEDLVGR